MYNGGSATIRSYTRNCGSFRIPYAHEQFYDNLKFYHENRDFIAVHAGLNPKIDNIADQDKRDLLWIRDEFYRAEKRWAKTVIFGHSPILAKSPNDLVFFDDKKNIIGIDAGVIFGKELACLRWPDRKIFSSEE
jgi:serine/threonine protein phosphatase 1